MVLAEIVGARASSSQGRGASLKGAAMKTPLDMKNRGFPLTHMARNGSATKARSRIFFPGDHSRWAVTHMSFDILARFPQNAKKPGRNGKTSSEPIRPAYEICCLAEDGSLTYKFSAT